MTWYGADGDTRRAQLTERGRRYVERLRETRPRDQEIVISGRITELRESGWVKVKTGTARNAQAYDVHFEEPEALLRMRPGLGDNVHFRVRFRQCLDAVGIARSTEYTISARRRNSLLCRLNFDQSAPRTKIPPPQRLFGSQPPYWTKP